MQDFNTLSDEELENIANGGAGGGQSLDYAKMSDEELESIASGGAPQSVGNIGGRSFDDMSDDELEMVASGRPLPQTRASEPVQTARQSVGRIGMMTTQDDFANREAMSGATKASLQSQADLGVGAEAVEDDGSVTNWVKNLWNGISANSTGKITARNTMKNAQELMRGTVNGVPLENLPDEETDYLLDSAGANGVYNYFASFLPKAFRGKGSLMEEWDNGPGARIEDPVERKRQRVAYAKSIAQGMVEQNEESKRNAAMELKGRDKEWQADFTGGLVTNGAYMLPYMATLGMDKGVIAGVVEGLDRYNELRSDAYRVDDDGNMYVDAERDTAGKAALKATARGVMAPLIEKFGGELVAGAGGAILKNTIGRAPLVKAMGGKLMATAAGKALNRYVKTMHNFSKATGLHSSPGEFAEEFEDQVLDAAFGTDRRDSETNGNVLSRAGESAAEFMKPENLLDLAKSMVLVQMIGGGTSHALDRRLARYTDGILTRVAGVDQDKLDGYTADEKAAALKAWWANQSEEEVVKSLGRGAKSVADLLSAIRERAGNYDFSATDGVADEERAFTIPTVIDENGQSVADFQDITDDAGRAVKRMIDGTSGISIDAITQDDGTVAYKVRGRFGRVRSAETADEAREIADQMAKRSARNDRKIDYLNTLREQGRALSGMDVVAGDTMREAIDAFGNQYGEDEKRRLMGGDEFQSGYKSNNPSLRFKLADGREGVLLNLGAIDSVGDMQNFATHEAVTHSGLDMVFGDPKMRAEFLKAVGSDKDMDKDEFLSQIDKDAFRKVGKDMYDAVIRSQIGQRRANGFMSADDILKDDVAREEVFAWVTERIHTDPSFKNKAVSALRKLYRRAFNADLKYNADELATMFDTLRDMATSRDGGSLRYRSVEQSAERDKASSDRDRTAANAIRNDAESQPMQLENKQFSIEDGHRILMEMQGKAAGTVAGAKTADVSHVQAQQNAPQSEPSEARESARAKPADAPLTAQGVSVPKPESPSFVDMSDADLGKYVSDLKQFELLNDFGRKNLANAEKEQRKRARAAEAEKRKAEAERKAKEKAEADERQFKADNEQAFAEWLKKRPGRTDSKASRDDYAGDMGGAISSVVHSLGRGHGTKAPSTHLRAVLRGIADNLSGKWKFKLGDAAYDLDSVLDNLDKAGKLYGKDGKMALAPFGTMVDRSYPSVRRDVKDKVARRLRDAFADMYESHKTAVKNKNAESYGHLTQKRSDQAKKNLVDREGKKVRAAVRSYADAHPESAIAAWHDWFNGAKDSAAAIDAFFDDEKFDDAAMQELANNAPEIGIAKDANGNVDATQLEKTAKRLKDELANAMREAEAGEAEIADVERDAAETEPWMRIRDTKPSWWGKEPWDLTEAEERDQEEYFRQKDEADAEVARDAEELGLSPDEMNDGARVMWRRATPDESERLDGEETVRVYRAMQMIGGKLYPPMAAKIEGKFVDPTELGEWQVADVPSEERLQEMIRSGQIVVKKDGSYRFKLDKGNGKSIYAAYNPYWHTSRSLLNDQFSSAYYRPELVTVEVEVPVSELTAGHKEPHAKDSVGELEWKSGVVTKQLVAAGKPPRRVILSRYCRVVRVVPNAEVVDGIKKMLDGTDVGIPINTVNDDMLKLLVERGVKIEGPREVAANQKKAIMRDVGDKLNKIQTAQAGGTSVQWRTEDVERTSREFDNEVQRQIDGDLEEDHVYNLGYPSEILLSTGIPSLPIQLTAKRLAFKSGVDHHPFRIEELKGLVRSIRNPVAIFAYGDKNKAQNLIIDVQHEGKNFVVGLSIKPAVGGNVLAINSIRTIYPKDNHEWMNWISQGELLYVDKNKIQVLFGQHQTNPDDVPKYFDLDLVRSIAQNFVNPQYAKSSAVGGVQK